MATGEFRVRTGEHRLSTGEYRANADARIPFIMDLALALQAAGYSTHRLEDALTAMSDRLGLTGQYFVTPTSIFASFGSGITQSTYMMRTGPRPQNLGQLARVTEVARGVLSGEVQVAEGMKRLMALSVVPDPNPLFIIIGHGLASAAAARFLGGAWPEMGMAALGGLGIGALATTAARLPHVARVYEFLAAFLCSTIMTLLGALIGGYSVWLATLAGLIVLIPGLTLTTAITELATSHLTAGTTRMAGAFMTFIGIGFGVALGHKVAVLLVGPVAAVMPAPMPVVVNWLALGVIAIAFSLLLRADRRDIGWILLSAVIAFVSTRLGGSVLGPEMGVFVGALAVGLGSNLFYRITRRPAAITLVPGLLTLVPGSVGFRSISALLDSQVVAGIDTAFSMVLTAVSLVAGLLTSAAIYPEDRFS